MFKSKMKTYFETSFQLLDNYLNDSLILNNREIQAGEWVMFCSVIAERNGQLGMFSIQDILEINRKENINFLQVTGSFSVVLIRGFVEEVNTHDAIVRIEENEETVFYELKTPGKRYNNLLSTDSFLWNISASRSLDSMKFINPTLEELPLFFLNLTRLPDVYPAIASKVLNTMAGIIYDKEDQWEECRDWYEEKRIPLVNLFKKAQAESTMAKH